tara:strand:- start:1698 stop:2099 length:402 start_codon:yes stop_codon:yes gene_type:complete
MLKDFTTQGDNKNPKIVLRTSGDLSFHGRSLPENAKEIFKPILEWLNQYKDVAAEETNINFQLEYFNTTSSKMIYEVIKIGEEMLKSGKKVNVNWYYEKDDTDLKYEGVLISSTLDLELNFIEIDEFQFDHFN